MIFPTHTCNPIVRSWSGQGTCETVYQTADGRVWRQNHIDYSHGTVKGPTLGRMHGNHICEEPQP